MCNSPNTESLVTRRFRVAVIEWTTYTAEIEADSAADATYKARRLWMEDADNKLFAYESSGYEGAVAEELPV